jgi:hypothetical protein
MNFEFQISLHGATFCFLGTTWLSEVAWQVFSEGQTGAKPLRVRVPYLESLEGVNHLNTKEERLAFIVNAPYPRVFKTHLPHHLAPRSDNPNTKPKYIYLMRNPKDCAVSYYHHYKGFKAHEFDGPWEEFLELFMAGDRKYRYGFQGFMGMEALHDHVTAAMLDDITIGIEFILM